MKKNKCKININFTMNNSSNYLKKQIKDLNAGDQKIVLTCLVISKADPKFFEFNGQQRGVWNLILRDTEKDYINCTIWNTDEKIHDLNSIISIGCIVDIENPKITIEDEDQAFQPKCSSRFLLTIDDKRGNITLNNDFDVNNQLKILLKCPLKNTNEILRLADVSLYDKNSVGELVDLLVAIRYNRPAREILVPKTGLKKKYKSLIVMDRSNHGMSLNLWSTQSVERAENWPPLQTILFITDVRVGFSEYFQTITLTETVKTLFIVNPIGKEAEELAMYVMSTPLKDIEVSLSDDMIDVNRINDVMTVQQILEKSEGNVTRTEGDQFTALCYGVLTKFDLDGVYPCVRRRCELCKQFMALEEVTCRNEDCHNIQYLNSQHNCIKTFFTIPINITDHSGTLENCRLYNKFAETMIGVNVNDFLEMNDDGKAILKWKYLLERCAFKLVIRKKSVCRSKTLISVVACSLVKSNEIVKDLKIY